MSKTVALHPSAAGLTGFLESHGFTVITTHEANHPHTHVDAVLYNGRRLEPEWVSAYSAESIDLGSAAAIPQLFSGLSTTIILNTAGLYPEQILDTLSSRLRHRYINR